MQDLNYHHLTYFWAVAKDGSVQRAAERLHLAQSTISGQIKHLEQQLGGALLQRRGRHLELTDLGHHVFRYADDIVTLGRDLVSSIEDGGAVARPSKLVVGIADVVPKLAAYKLLAPVLELPGDMRLTCHEDDPKALLSALAIQRLDMVLSDAPMPADLNVKAYNHLLGEAPVAIFGPKSLVNSLEGSFPQCLTGAPFLLPSDHSNLRRELELWFDRVDVHPRIVGEFDDSALMKVFAAHGHGLFASPLVGAEVILNQLGGVELGIARGVVERFYAITPERRVRHPAIVSIQKSAAVALSS